MSGQDNGTDLRARHPLAFGQLWPTAARNEEEFAMRTKLLTVLALLAGALVSGSLASPASAFPPVVARGHYLGYGAHDYLPYEPGYPTPLGPLNHYSRGLHDVLPLGHTIGQAPTYGGHYAPPPSHGAPSYPYGVGSHGYYRR